MAEILGGAVKLDKREGTDQLRRKYRKRGFDIDGSKDTLRPQLEELDEESISEKLFGLLTNS